MRGSPFASSSTKQRSGPSRQAKAPRVRADGKQRAIGRSLPFDEAPDEEIAGLTRRQETRPGQRRVRRERRQWRDHGALGVRPEADDVTGMSRSTGKPGIARPEEVSDPRFGDMPGQTVSRARERVPPRNDRPAVTASSGESGDVSRRGPYPPAGGHDNVRREATQRGERRFRHVQVAVEARLEAEPTTIRAKSSVHESRGTCSTGRSVSGCHRRSRSTGVSVTRRSSMSARSAAGPERSQVRSHHADDDGDPHGARRKFLR